MADKNPEDQKPAASGVSLMGKVAIGGVVGVFVLVESVVAYMMLPNPDTIATKVREEIKAEITDKTEEADDPLEKQDTTNFVEAEIGNFNIMVHQHAANTTLTIACKVMATIDKNDKSEFDTLLENNKNRLRERIIIEFRSSEVDDLKDAGLGLLKRRILEKSNLLLGKPFIKSIMFPEYNYYQQ